MALPEGAAWWETREFLESIDASQNELTSLPVSFGMPVPPDHFGRPEPHPLEQLRELNLSHNKLTNLLGAENWRELRALVNLNVAHNALVQLPDGFGADNLPPLVKLDCTHNQLRAVPPSLGQLVELVELDLSHNSLGGLAVNVVEC